MNRVSVSRGAVSLNHLIQEQFLLLELNSNFRTSVKSELQKDIAELFVQTANKQQPDWSSKCHSGFSKLLTLPRTGYCFQLPIRL